MYRYVEPDNSQIIFVYYYYRHADDFMAIFRFGLTNIDDFFHHKYEKDRLGSTQ